MDKVLGIVGVFALGLAAALALSLPVEWMWNAFFPPVTGLRPITWLQALWLCLLCELLLGSRASLQRG
jgi:hypothetical protein